MTPFLAIVKLTARAAMRSHVFQFLLAILIAGIFLLPLTINGSAGPKAFIQVSLEYSLTFISTMLVLSAIWLGCQTMTADIEDARLHMLVVKPVSRVIIWLGKLAGVTAILSLLLLISTTVVYGLILYQYSRLEMKPEEREAMQNEVLTARKAYYPEAPDINQFVQDAFARHMSTLSPDGKKLLDRMSAAEREKAMETLYRQVVANLAEIKVGSYPKTWTYKGLPDLKDGVFYVRYKAYSGSIDFTKNQEIAYGLWIAECFWQEPVDPKTLKPGEKAPPPEKKSAFVLPRDLRVSPPEEILCGPYNEFKMPSKELKQQGISLANIIVDGKATIGFINCPPSKKPIFIQAADGPAILIRAAGFTENYIRAVLVMFFGVFGISMVSVSLGSLLSLPVAIFATLSYLFFGFVSDFLAGSLTTYGSAANMPLMERWGYYLSQILLSSVIPVQRFGISGYVSGGELIEWKTIGFLFLFQLVVKGLPLALFCIWIYRRRELALASIKR